MAKSKKQQYTYAKGRRKTSVATIRLYEGKGDNEVNGKKLKEVYPSQTDQKSIMAPLKLLDKTKDFYFTTKTSGGGVSGQAGAIIHALARALQKHNPDFRSDLKKAGFLMRDPRMVERKHTGRRKARKSEQYSKR